VARYELIGTKTDDDEKLTMHRMAQKNPDNWPTSVKNVTDALSPNFSQHKFTSWWSGIRCCWAAALESSAHIITHVRQPDLTLDSFHHKLKTYLMFEAPTP